MQIATTNNFSRMTTILLLALVVSLPVGLYAAFVAGIPLLEPSDALSLALALAATLVTPRVLSLQRCDSSPLLSQVLRHVLAWVYGWALFLNVLSLLTGPITPMGFGAIALFTQGLPALLIIAFATVDSISRSIEQ